MWKETSNKIFNPTDKNERNMNTFVIECKFLKRQLSQCYDIVFSQMWFVNILMLSLVWKETTKVAIKCVRQVELIGTYCDRLEQNAHEKPNSTFYAITIVDDFLYPNFTQHINSFLPCFLNLLYLQKKVTNILVYFPPAQPATKEYLA